MTQPPAESRMPDQSQSLLDECRKLLSAWVELDAERSRLTQSLYSSGQSPEQITSLLDQNDRRRTDLATATQRLLKRLNAEE